MTKGFTKLRKKLTAAHLLSVSFLVYILFVSLAALPEFLYHLGGAFYWETGYTHFIETVDQQYSGMLSTDKDAPLLQNKGSYINFNGAMARVLGQPMMNDRVLLKNGHLSHVLPNAPEPEAASCLSWPRARSANTKICCLLGIQIPPMIRQIPSWPCWKKPE